MKYKVLTIAIGLALLAAGCNKAANNTPVPNNPPDTTDNSAQAPQTITVNMTAAGFSPDAISINQGDTITFVNTDTNPHWPASAPHPTHTDYPAFDAKADIMPGASWSFTFDQVGTWKFHDHLNPSHVGSVTVK